MEVVEERTVSRDRDPILQLKRSLVPIDEYATREGVSRDIVEQCGQLGIVQIRKYKGRTFVVDVPLSPYPYASGAGGASAQVVNKAAGVKKLSELVGDIVPEESVTPKDSEIQVLDEPEPVEESEEQEESVEPGVISGLVKKMFRNASAIIDKPTETTDDDTDPAENIPDSTQTVSIEVSEHDDQPVQLTRDSGRIENIPEPVQTGFDEPFEVIDEPIQRDDEITEIEKLPPIEPPDFEIFETADEHLPVVTDETLEIEEWPDSVRIPQSDLFQLDSLAAQARAGRHWQLAAVFSMAAFLVVVFVALWLHSSRKANLDRLNHAFASIQAVHQNSIKANRRAEAFQKELDGSETQIRQLQSERDKLDVEVKNILGELNKSRAELRHLRSERNISTAEVENALNELDQTRANLELVQQRNAEIAKRLNERIRKLPASGN